MDCTMEWLEEENIFCVLSEHFLMSYLYRLWYREVSGDVGELKQHFDDLPEKNTDKQVLDPVLLFFRFS